jgi:hypothetical protein
MVLRKTIKLYLFDSFNASVIENKADLTCDKSCSSLAPVGVLTQTKVISVCCNASLTLWATLKPSFFNVSILFLEIS